MKDGMLAVNTLLDSVGRSVSEPNFGSKSAGSSGHGNLSDNRSKSSDDFGSIKSLLKTIKPIEKNPNFVLGQTSLCSSSVDAGKKTGIAAIENNTSQSSSFAAAIAAAPKQDAPEEEAGIKF
jgi:hypothetical protein